MTMLYNGEPSACVPPASSRPWRHPWVAGVLIGFLAATGGARAEDPGFPAPTGDPSVLPAGAKLDRVFDSACRLTEGVATSPDGTVYFSDITFTKFWGIIRLT